MKGFFLHILFLVPSSILSAQHLDVQGHGKLRGNFHLGHMNDITSVYVSIKQEQEPTVMCLDRTLSSAFPRVSEIKSGKRILS